MRVVLDTNVIVAAFRSPKGASARLIEAVQAGLITPVANVALFAEWEAVLKREVHAAEARARLIAIDEALDELAQLVAPAERSFYWRPQLADPDDEMVLEAAVNGAAAVISTFEVTTFVKAASSFGIEVLTPGRLWSKLKP